MSHIGKPPCDEGVLRGFLAVAPVPREGEPWILAATILGSSMAFVDGTVVNVALPVLQAELDATATEVQWIVESYALFLASLLLVGGALGDRLGRRRVFASGIALFSLASASCGLASTMSQLIAARALQGVGAALLVPGSLAILSAGLASGINNAVARTAGLLAIAALGVILTAVFNRSLDRELRALELSPEQRSTVNEERVKLAGADLPREIFGGKIAHVGEAVEVSLVDGFRAVMWSASLLAFLGGLAAFRLPPR